MGILRRKAAVGWNTPPATALHSTAPPADKRNLRTSRRSRSLSQESGVHHTARTFKASWKEYCNSTAIHGVHYFVAEGRTRFERVFWVLSLVLSVGGCFCLIQQVYAKWEQSPVIVSFAEKSLPIGQVPFPAVTICPEIKFKRKLFNSTEVYNRFRENESSIEHDEKKKLQVTNPLCLNPTRFFREATSFSAEEYRNTLTKLAPPMREVFYLCLWRHGKDKNSRCKDLFSPVLTFDGLCYTFNMLNNEDLFTPQAVQYRRHNLSKLDAKTSTTWNLDQDGGYKTGAALNTYPRRVLGHSADSGFIIILEAFRTDYEPRCRWFEGFKVLLHNPAEFPRIGQQFFRVPLDQEVVVLTKPSMMTTSKGLLNYKPSHRQCYLTKDRPLKYFKVYTQKNCELECFSDYTMEKCNCTAFYMPNLNPSYRICELRSSTYECLVNTTEESMVYEIQRDLHRLEGRAPDLDCDCLPACTSLEYEALTSQTMLDTEAMLHTLAMLSIYFKDSQFIPSRRSELYGRNDFLAYCGGLLSLFSGFSLISLIEILYYLTIRLWCNVCRTHQQRRTGAELANGDPERQQAADIEDPPNLADRGPGPLFLERV